MNKLKWVDNFLNIYDKRRRGMPDLLYHYTSQKGFLGIINNKKIWATNIHYLNDASEYKYAADLIVTQIDKRLENFPSRLKTALSKNKTKKNDFIDFEIIFLKRLKKLILGEDFFGDRREVFYVFVCSFSEKGDQLSQWRGYCPNGNGLSIGFKTSTLITKMKKHGFYLLRCIYDIKDQLILIDKLIDRLIKHMKSSLKNPNLKNKKRKLIDLAFHASVYFLILAVQFKHATFEEEKEWRFFSVLHYSKIKDIEYREGISMITPYVSVPLAENDKNIFIDHLIVGPTPHPLLSLKSIASVLYSKKMGYPALDLSKTPYRTW